MRKKRNKIGIILMFLGTLLLTGAVFLFFWNYQEDRKAQETSMEILKEITEQIENKGEQETPVIKEFYSETMPEKVIDGYSYIGYLSLPSVNLYLPVMAECDYGRLKIAPCRYYGSTVTDNLVIAAHNYASHFGKLKALHIGDLVTFTNMDGRVKQYEVAEVNILDPEDVGEMINGEFELSMYTCTYGGKSRLTIRCMEIK